jgi:methylglyoxal synthase
MPLWQGTGGSAGPSGPLVVTVPQYVIYQKPSISPVASAFDWIEMECIRAGFAAGDTADRFHAISSQTLALIARDAMKSQVASVADDHFELLSRFAYRVSTGTTGRKLNELARARGWPQGRLCMD